MSTRLNFYSSTSCKPSLSHRISTFLRLRWLGSYFPTDNCQINHPIATDTVPQDHSDFETIPLVSLLAL
ncbi:hypothetical protein L873DRAFT_1808615, partial [Choiromyces venosus 120613-1]